MSLGSFGDSNRELVWKLSYIIAELLKALPPEKRSGGFNVTFDNLRFERLMLDGPGGLPIRTSVREDRMRFMTDVRVFLVGDFENWVEEQKKAQPPSTPKRYFELD